MVHCTAGAILAVTLCKLFGTGLLGLFKLFMTKPEVLNITVEAITDPVVASAVATTLPPGVATTLPPTITAALVAPGAAITIGVVAAAVQQPQVPNAIWANVMNLAPPVANPTAVPLLRSLRASQLQQASLVQQASVFAYLNINEAGTRSV